MILVIDAYNVLKAHERMNDINQKQRYHFIMQLVAYAKKKDHTVVIVFDGGPYEWPFVNTISRGTVVYSGYNKTADDYIRKYLAEHKHLDLFLVSSDRELIRKAKQCNVHYMGGYEFFEKVKESVAVTTTRQQKEVIKLTHRDNKDIDDLMMQAAGMANVVKKTEANVRVHDKGSPCKKSKTERIIERKIDKL